MKASYTLVIIDMQSSFVAARHPGVQNECKSLIKRAMKDNAPIIFVELISHGRTMECLFELADHYEHVYVARKQNESGADEVDMIITSNDLPWESLVVCGVNTDMCVSETVLTLAIDFNYKISLAHKACNAESSDEHENGIEYLSKHIRNSLFELV